MGQSFAIWILPSAFLQVTFLSILTASLLYDHLLLLFLSAKEIFCEYVKLGVGEESASFLALNGPSLKHLKWQSPNTQMGQAQPKNQNLTLKSVKLLSWPPPPSQPCKHLPPPDHHQPGPQPQSPNGTGCPRPREPTSYRTPII